LNNSLFDQMKRVIFLKSNMKSPIKSLALAFLAPIGVLAVPTYTTVITIDDFSDGYADVSGTGSSSVFAGYTGPYSNVSGTNLFARTLRVQGTYPTARVYTAIGYEDQGLSLSTPVTSTNSLLKVTYGVMDDLNWLSLNSANYLKLEVSYSSDQGNFTWTLRDGNNNTATWYQEVAALNSVGTSIYAKKLSDFTTSGLFNWASVRSLEFSSATKNGVDTDYAGGFLISSYSGASIPEPSTYGIGLGALALATVAIRRRKAVKA
jgi:PEP-CTERM motif